MPRSSSRNSEFKIFHLFSSLWTCSESLTCPAPFWERIQHFPNLFAHEAFFPLECLVGLGYPRGLTLGLWSLLCGRSHWDLPQFVDENTHAQRGRCAASGHLAAKQQGWTSALARRDPSPRLFSDSLLQRLSHLPKTHVPSLFPESGPA